jgi:hypothetical protein
MAPLWLSAWTSSVGGGRACGTSAPGHGADAIIWEELEQNAGEETRLSVSYLTFMVVAMLIASMGVLVDQPILIVGAMVVGPEFGPLVALCVAIVARQPRRAGTALGAFCWASWSE